MNALVLGNNACVGLLVTATHLEENSSGASWGEGVAVGSRFHSARGRPLVRQARNSKLRDWRRQSPVVQGNSAKPNVVAVRR